MSFGQKGFHSQDLRFGLFTRTCRAPPGTSSTTPVRTRMAAWTVWETVSDLQEL